MRRKLLFSIAKRLPFKTGMFIAEVLLAGQGFGSGGSVQSSGETGVFDLLEGDSPLLIDIGAHTGEYTQAFLARFPKGRVVIFEPSETHVRLLRQHLGAAANVRVIQKAAGAASESAILYKNADVTGGASLTRRRLDHLGIRMDIEEKVSVTTLDAELADIGTPIDLVKIDVEGHELDVLKGAMTLLDKRRIKRIQFEFGGTHLDTRTSLQDFFYFLEPRGFAIHVIRPDGTIQPLGRYREIYEQYRTTNFLALLDRA